MRRIPGNKLELGIVDGKGVPLEMTPQMRSTHLYICGSTGTGKSTCIISFVKGASASHQISRSVLTSMAEQTWQICHLEEFPLHSSPPLAVFFMPWYNGLAGTLTTSSELAMATKC
jgi:hypothetical protein